MNDLRVIALLTVGICIMSGCSGGVERAYSPSATEQPDAPSSDVAKNTDAIAVAGNSEPTAPSEEPIEASESPAVDGPPPPGITGSVEANPEVVEDQAVPESRPLPVVRLLIGARDGLYAMAEDRSLTKLSERGTPMGLAVREDRIFLYRWGRIMEIDQQANELRTIPVPDGANGYGFVALPNDRFAVLNNREDEVYILDAQGELLSTVHMLTEPNQSLQNTHGTVIGTQLIVSEDGQGRILTIDLETFAAEVLHDVSSLRRSLSAVAYDNESLYVCTARHIYRLTSDAEPELLATTDRHNICDIAIVDDFALVPVNFGGAILAIDLSSRTSQVLLEGLNYPEQILVLPR